MRPSLPALAALLACFLIGACSKPVSQRMEGEWTFDDAASAAGWERLGTPLPARKKITSLIDAGTIRLSNGTVTLITDHGRTSTSYEILQDGDRLLVARMESRDAHKRVDVKVEMRSDDRLTLTADYPMTGASAILTRKQVDGN